MEDKQLWNEIKLHLEKRVRGDESEIQELENKIISSKSIRKIEKFDEVELRVLFELYLEKKGYSKYTPKGLGSTVFYYPQKIDDVIYYEKTLFHKDYKNWFDVISTIKQLLKDYAENGIKHELGAISHNSVISALRRFYEFLQYLSTDKHIEFEYLLTDDPIPHIKETIEHISHIKETIISNPFIPKDAVNIGDIVVWETNDLEIKRQIVEKEIVENLDNEISYNAELAKKSLGQKQGAEVTLDAGYRYIIKEIIRNVEKIG